MKEPTRPKGLEPRATGNVRLTRWLLRAALLAVAACAAIGVGALLLDDINDVTGRVLLTCLSVAFGSVTGLACATCFERDRFRQIAAMGMATSAVAVLLLVVGIWTEFLDHNQLFGKSTFLVGLVSAALAHISLLSIPRLSSGFSWVRSLTWFAVTAVVLLISYGVVLESEDEFLWRAIGVLSILAAGGTIGVPIAFRLSGLAPEIPADAPPPEQIEIFCPRCRRRQKLFFESAHCSRCALEIRIAIVGWEESQGQTTRPSAPS